MTDIITLEKAKNWYFLLHYHCVYWPKDQSLICWKKNNCNQWQVRVRVYLTTWCILDYTVTLLGSMNGLILWSYNAWFFSHFWWGLTQTFPVSIPSDSLLVSGLKNMHEHCAEDKSTQKGSDSDENACDIFFWFSGLLRVYNQARFLLTVEILWENSQLLQLPPCFSRDKRD